MPSTATPAPVRTYWPHLAILLVGAGVFIDLLTGVRHLSPTNRYDFFTQWLPYWLFLKSEYLRFNFPLWCHNLLAGFPLSDFPHAGAFYPLNAVLCFFDFERMLTVFYLLHFGLLGLFSYGCAREFGASRAASFLAGAGLPLSGIFLGRLTASNDNNAVVWATAGLWCMTRHLNRPRLRELLGLAGATGLAALAGNYEAIIFCYATFLAFLLATRRPAPGKLLGVAAAMALGLFLGAAQFLPAVGYIGQSFRHFHDIQELERGGGVIINNLYLLLFFWPTVPIPANTPLLYTGLVPLLGALLLPPGRERRSLAVIAAVVAMMVINLPPMNHVFQALPVLGDFSAPSVRYRALFGVFILVVTLGARGLDRILAPGPDFPAREFLAVVVLFLLAQAGWVGLGYARFDWFSSLLPARFVFMFALLAVSLLVALRRRKNPFSGRAFLLTTALLLLDLGLPSFILVPRSTQSSLHQPAYSALAKRQGVLDRVHLVSPITQDQTLWRMVRLNRGPGFITGFIRNGINSYNEIIARIRPSIDLFNRETIQPPNQPLLDYLAVKYLVVLDSPAPGSNPLLLGESGLHSNYSGPGPASVRPPESDGAFTLSPGWSWRLKLELYPEDRLCFETAGSSPPALRVSVAAGDRQLPSGPAAAAEDGYCLSLPVGAIGERLVSLRVPETARAQVIYRPRISGSRRPYRLASVDGRVRLYHNERALSRYGLYHQYSVLAPGRSLEALFDPGGFDPRRSLLFSADDFPSGSAASSSLPRSEGVRVVGYRDSAVDLETESSAPGFLSVAEVYYPGWRVWVDGLESRILRANHAFRAVPVPAGRHRVEFRYEPRSFRVGLWVMVSSVLAAVAVAGARYSGAGSSGPGEEKG